mgnify:CR=1 FL=1
MTSADKFGIAFAIGITAVMIGLISGGTFETSQPSPIQSAPTQTYSPPPQAAVEESAPAQAPIIAIFVESSVFPISRARLVAS